VLEERLVSESEEASDVGGLEVILDTGVADEELV